MKFNNYILTAVSFLLVLLFQGSSFADIYRWVDERGVKHFSDSPPPKVVKKPPKKVAKRAPVRKNSLYDLRERVAKTVGVDTIILASGKRVKYIGVESSSDFLIKIGSKEKIEEAGDFHRKLVKGKVVTVLLGKKAKDDEGRYLGHVFLGQEAFINAELIRNGYAITKEYPADFEYQSLFIRLMKDARKRGVGIWRF